MAVTSDVSRNVWAALESCRTPAKRRAVAEAIAACADALCRADLRSRHVWTLMGLCDGQEPVTDEEKRVAGRKIAAARRRAG